ncbi:MAG: acetoin utilization protein AcuC, partial [Candidatus Eisenbacteria bacterium]|nr:acetoin utilization protein AcuC [Candidatus Eisenbacteria bacterium]
MKPLPRESRLFLDPRLGRFSYGRGHPFQPRRAADAILLARSLGLLEPGQIETSPPVASREELEAFHAPPYLDALERAVDLPPRDCVVWGLGDSDNPVFEGLWDYVRIVAGGSLAAVRWILEGEPGRPRAAFHPGGGLHHAHRDRAAGFCYVNDGALAILEAASAGLRVCYVDIDAHHGDGVQEAFYESDRVLTISVHQDGRTLFPGTGFPNEIGRDAGEGYAINVPLLPGSGDPEYEIFRESLLVPLLDRFRPDLIVTEIGVDSMRDDPLALLDLTLEGLDRFLETIEERGTSWLALGGGGYRPWNAIRGWSLVWASLQGKRLPEHRPENDPEGRPLPASWPVRLWDEAPAREVS